MSTAMLFAQPWRAPAEFITEQHALGRRPGQLEASTAMARALFGPYGQRQILLEHAPHPDHADPDHLGRLRLRAARPPRPSAAVNLLPDGQLSVFPDCGHLPHVEQPDRFAAVLGDWLTEPRDHPGSVPLAPAPSPAPSKGQR